MALKRFALYGAATLTALTLTSCGGDDQEDDTSTSSGVPFSLDIEDVKDENIAYCNVNPDGSFHIAEAELVIAGSGLRSMHWRYDEPMPQGSVISFGAVGENATMGVKIKNGEVVDNYWMDLGSGQNTESVFPVEQAPGEVSVAVPPAIAPSFNREWSADMSVDGTTDATCKHF